MNNDKMSKSEAGKLGSIKAAESRKEREKLKIEEYNKCPKTCFHCKSIIPYEDRKYKVKYCSSKCSYLSHKDKLIELSTKRGKYCLKKCSNCDNLTKSKYCSISCLSESFRIRRIKKLKDNLFSGNLSAAGSHTLRRALFDIRGKCCESCGLTHWKLKTDDEVFIEKELQLTVHHKDGDASNNKLENLQILCWNCHSLTDNYGSKNKNSTRHYRRKK